MSKTILVIVSLVILGTSLSCKSLLGKETSQNNGSVTASRRVDPAEMDCKQAEDAYSALMAAESSGRKVEGIEPMSPAEYKSKLERKLLECKGASSGTKAYRVNGQSNNVSFTGEICSLERPFSIDAKFPGGTAKTTFTPGDKGAGSTTVSGGGGGCTHSGGGKYTVIIAPDGGASLSWTTTDTIACPGFSNSRTATFKLPLQPVSDLKCQ